MKNILVYGDSNTWGLHPPVEDRYPFDVRWPGRLSEMLGSEYHVIENAISGRTTYFDDPLFRNMNGMSLLEGVLAASKPLDMVIIALGTNDFKFTDVKGSTMGISMMVKSLLAGDSHFVTPGSKIFAKDKLDVIIVSPVPLDDSHIEKHSRLYGYQERIPQMAESFRDIAEFYGVGFVDGSVIKNGISEADGIHMNPDGHRQLAELVYKEVRRIYG